jgi:hypothetical protein
MSHKNKYSHNPAQSSHYAGMQTASENFSIVQKVAGSLGLLQGKLMSNYKYFTSCLLKQHAIQNSPLTIALCLILQFDFIRILNNFILSYIYM